MQHVTSLELVTRSVEYLGARQFWSGMQQGHHILELVAEPKGPAGLIERRTSPNAAGQCLVEQPAVEHQIHAALRCLNRNCPQDIIPLALDGLPSSFNLASCLVLINQ